MTTIILIVFAVIILIFAVAPIRRLVISMPIMKIVGRILPQMGDTERIALEAGTVGWDGELFSGKPDWNKLLDFEIKDLTEEEQAFLDGPVEELCRMVDDWQVMQDRDLSPEVWDFIKKNKFLGMIIPKEYGGLGFSAHLHSAVVTKVSSHSATTAVTVMVPNSLGPGELLMEYGTDAQKKHYLPRLAVGDEIPCFALTEPGAGSDAANGQSNGVVCKGTWEGKETLGIRMNFNKRYITLAPVATVLGVAFKLFDPDHLLGDVEDIGITCALVPSDVPGVVLGNRHDPMGIPFMNGPVTGKNVFIPIDYIIGGAEQAGTGWRMLMENLAAGRCISLPSLSVGAAEVTARATSAYANVREQFGLPIGRFEGVRERLARIGGFAYFMNASRRLAFGYVDAGERPSVVSAIVKAYMTESMRLTLNDGMDIHAGSAISRGPDNIFARAYMSIPIGITVEGANILTRSLIIFGQGAMRCHPFVQHEMQAVADKDVEAFDAAFFGHLGHIAKTGVRAKWHGLTGAIFAGSPVEGFEAKYYRDITRFSAVFALAADIALGTLGGALKRKEHISGRFADAFGWMFIATATLKHFNDQGRPDRQRAYVDYACTHALYQVERALIGVFDNLPNRFIATIFKFAVFPYGTKYKRMTDTQMEAVADAMLLDDEARQDITGDIFIPAPDQPGLGKLEAAFAAVRASRPASDKIAKARRSGQITKAPTMDMAKDALSQGIIDKDELALLETADRLRDEVIQVSDFAPEPFAQMR